MRTRLIFALLLCLSVTGFAQESSIDFVIRNLGINVDGHFDTFTITTRFDASNQLEKLSGEIKANSIETGIDSRDEHLLEEDYFYVSKYPSIVLESTEIKKQSENNYTVKASLRLKGKTKQVSFPLKVVISDNSRKISANFEINRKDFNVGGSSFVMSKTVKINVVHVEKTQ